MVETRVFRSFGTVVLPWNGQAVICRGVADGLPVFGFGAVPPGLCTWRQLRAKGLRPDGADPVALLGFRHRKPFRRAELCDLFREDIAVPVRPMTPARWAAHEAAMRARRFCRTHQGHVDHCVRGPLKQCSTCFADDTTDSERSAA